MPPHPQPGDGSGSSTADAAAGPRKQLASSWNVPLGAGGGAAGPCSWGTGTCYCSPYLWQGIHQGSLLAAAEHLPAALPAQGSCSSESVLWLLPICCEKEIGALAATPLGQGPPWAAPGVAINSLPRRPFPPVQVQVHSMSKEQSTPHPPDLLGNSLKQLWFIPGR